MGDETYEGWTNRDTWLVPLWIDNDQGLYQLKREMLARFDDEITGRDARDIGQQLLGMFEEMTPGAAGPSSDGLNYNRVDWLEIAEHWELERLEMMEECQ